MHRSTQATIFALAALLMGAILAPALLPAAAGAGGVIPPDNSGVDQYAENQPSGGGDRSARGPRGKGSGPGLPVATTTELSAYGSDGVVAAALADDASRAVPVHKKSKGREDQGDDAVAAVGSALLGGSGGGSGVGFPLALLAITGVSIVTAVRRRRAN